MQATQQGWCFPPESEGSCNDRGLPEGVVRMVSLSHHTLVRG
jgi:hypothetical protein